VPRTSPATTTERRLGAFCATSTVPLVTSIIESDEATAFTMPAEAKVGSCAFEYTEATLAERSWAFDGTLIAVGTVGDSRMGSVPSATFDVKHWYRGGSSQHVTVQFEMGTTSELVPEVASGTRLLVSGEPRWGGQPTRRRSCLGLRVHPGVDIDRGTATVRGVRRCSIRRSGPRRFRGPAPAPSRDRRHERPRLR
jgi:hypothetical protein